MQYTLGTGQGCAGACPTAHGIFLKTRGVLERSLASLLLELGARTLRNTR
jgi:hypothetical protein